LLTLDNSSPSVNESAKAATVEDEDRLIDRFAEQTQLYLLVHEEQQHQSSSAASLLDSHHAFTSAFRSSHPLLDYDGGLGYGCGAAACRCLPRLVFCGFRRAPFIKTEGVATFFATSRLYEGDGEGRRHRYAEFRDTLRRRTIENNPFVVQDIRQQREAYFRNDPAVAKVKQQRQRNNKNGTMHGSADMSLDWNNGTDWKVVGLTQRSGRRRWRDLDSVVDKLRAIFVQSRILLVVVNVEDDDWNPYLHVTRHGALDALIGIHGAQLTEAVWMNPGSLVVELLPYVPDGIDSGVWTRTVTRPTPLGVIFDGTDLQHVGFPLDRDSAPYCYEDGRGDPLSCWKSEHPWDSRDFVLGADVLEDTIRRFVVDRPETCDDYRARAADEFVLYNVNCKEKGEEEAIPRHYYWGS